MVIASTFMSLLFAVVYSKVKNSILWLGIGILLIFIPIIVPKNGTLGKIFCMLPTIFCDTSLIVGENIKLSFGSMNISIMYLGSAVLLVLSILLYIMIKKTFWRGRVE